MVKQVSAGGLHLPTASNQSNSKYRKVIRDEHAKIGASGITYANFTIRRLLERIWSLVQNG